MKWNKLLIRTDRWYYEFKFINKYNIFGYNNEIKQIINSDIALILWMINRRLYHFSVL